MLFLLFINYIFICLPLTIYLAFYLKINTYGLWIGLTSSVIINDIVMLIIIYCSSFEIHIKE